MTAGFIGDATTTQQGGFLDLAPSGAVTFTLNNPGLGATNLATSTTASQPIASGGVATGMQVFASAATNAKPLSWIYRGGIVGAGTGIAGFATGAAQIPATGQATFTGDLNGIISEFHISGGEGYALLLGKVSIQADFAGRTLTGRISNLGVGSDGTYVTGPVNILDFAASYDPAQNAYVGEIVTGPSPGGPNAFIAGARGSIVLQYFGPDARELGAVFVISDGQSRAIGSLVSAR